MEKEKSLQELTKEELIASLELARKINVRLLERLDRLQAKIDYRKPRGGGAGER